MRERIDPPGTGPEQPVTSVDGEQRFTYRSARSGSFTIGIVIALLAETLVMHMWIANRHVLIAWFMTVTSLGAVVWLVWDYLSMGSGAVRLQSGSLHLDVGRRFAFQLPCANVESAVQPEWRDLPEAGTPAAAEYANLTKPASPNVLLTLREPTRLHIRSGFSRMVRRIALHVDDPQRLVTALSDCRDLSRRTY